jgi:acid phosphatase
MNRRVFLRSLFGIVALGTSTWAFLKESVAARALSSFVTAGDKEVANAPLTAVVFKEKSFKDIPAVKFLVIGDWGAGGSFQKSIATQMLLKAETEAPQFILSTGDNIYPNGVNSVDDKQWQTKFKNVYTGDALKLPWYAVLGNHDYRLSPEAQVEYSKVDPQWNMPERYFTFKKEFPDATNVEFFMLDTQKMLTDKAEREIQAKWLDEQLLKSKARWKVVVGHHMIRSHGIYGDQEFMLKSVKPVLDKRGVDIYICGHDHDLQLLKAKDDKFTCLISGAGGGARNTSYGENTKFAATNGGFNYIAVTNNELYIEFINRQGIIIFADSIFKS